MCHENGMDIVVDAFILLKKENGFDDVKLVLTGGSTGADTKFIKANMDKIKKAGLINDVELMHEFEGEARHRFFEKVSAISVPVRNGEAFGLYMIESMAAGVPMVQPALGAFPEIISKTKGGLVYDENTPEKLKESFKKLLSDSDLHAELSTNSRKGV